MERARQRARRRVVLRVGGRRSDGVAAHARRLRQSTAHRQVLEQLVIRCLLLLEHRGLVMRERLLLILWVQKVFLVEHKLFHALLLREALTVRREVGLKGGGQAV